MYIVVTVSVLGRYDSFRTKDYWQARKIYEQAKHNRKIEYVALKKYYYKNDLFDHERIIYVSCGR